MAHCGNKREVYKTSEASTKARMRTLGIIDQYLNVLDINNFNRFNAKWTNYARLQYNVNVGRLFSMTPEGKAVPNYAAFQRIDAAKGIRYPDNEHLFRGRSMPQLESKSNEAVDEQLSRAINTFLNSIGVSTQYVSEIKVAGTPLAANAVANITERVIKIAQGKESIDTLPEEAGHFFVALLGRDHTLYKAMDKQIDGTELYESIKNEYATVYGNDELAYREEAMGHMIAAELVAMARSGQLASQKVPDTRSQSIVRRIWDWIISKFKKADLPAIEKTVNPFRLVAEQIVENATDGLDWSHVDGLSREEFYSLPSNATVDDVHNALMHTTKTVSLRPVEVSTLPKRIQNLMSIGVATTDRYFDSDTNQVIENRFTDFVQRMFIRKKGKKAAEEMNARPDNHKKLEVGENVHAAMQALAAYYISRNESGKLRTDHIGATSTPEAIRAASGIDAALFPRLVVAVKDLIAQVVNQQTAIDPNGKVTIYPEQVIHNKLDRTAGTIDLLAVYSDKTASVFDYKTTSPTRGQLMLETQPDGSRVWKLVKYPVPSYKLDSFNIQIAGYKKALMNDYGITAVRHTRIVPVVVKLKFKPKDQRTPFNTLTTEIEVLQVGEKMSDFLRQIPVANELSDEKTLNQFIVKMRNNITQLENKLRNLRGDEYTKTVAKINDLRKAINDLLIKGDIHQTLVDVGRLVEFVENGMAENLQTVDGKPNPKYIPLADLLRYREEIRLYSDLHNYLSSSLAQLAAKDQTLAEQYKQLIYKFMGHMDDLVGRIEIRITEHVNDLKDKYETQGSERSAIGFMKATFGRLSEIKYNEFEIFSAMLSRQQEKRHMKMNLVKENIQAHQKALKEWASQNGMSLQQAYDKLINPTSGNMYGRLSKKFWDEYTSAKDVSDIAWMKEHMKPRDSYKENFERRKLRIQELLKAEFPVGQFTEEEAKRLANLRYQEWLNENDLDRDTAWFSMNARFSIEFKPEVFKDENLSDEFKYIKSNEPLLKFYEMIEGYNREARDMMGLRHSELPANMLPWIRQDIIDQIAQGSFSPGRAWSEFIEGLNFREDDTAFGDIDLETGEVKKSIPIYFLKPFRNEDGTIRTESKSRDIGNSMYLFMHMAYNYETMAEIESDTEALLQSIIANREGEIQRHPSGKAMLGKSGEFLRNISKTPKTTTELFELFRDYYIYGIHMRSKGITKKILGKEINSVKATQTAMQYLSLKTLGLAVLPGAAAFTAGMVGLRAESKKAAWLSSDNLHEAVKNYTSSRGDMKKSVALSRYFQAHQDDVTYREANDLYAKRMTRMFTMENMFAFLRKPDEVLDDLTLLAMARNWGFDKEGKLMRIDKLRKLQPDAKTIWEATTINEDGSLMIEGLSMNGFTDFRMAVKRVGAGIKGNMSEEDIMAFKTNIVTSMMMQFKNWMPGFLNERFGGMRYDAKYDITEQGRYPAFFSAFNKEAEKGIGEWLTTIVLPTLGQMSVDLVTFGAYKYKFNEVRAQKLYEEYLQSNNMTYSDMPFESFLEMKRGQTRAAIGELRAAMMVLSLILMLGADWDDDGQKNYNELWATRQLFKFVNRAQTEMAAGYSPAQFMSLIQNPIPLAALGKDIGYLLKNSYDEYRDIIVGEDDKRDVTPFGYYMSSMVPGFRQLNRIIEAYPLNQPGLQEVKD